MTAYYNDTEPYVCDWLERLIAAGHIAAGDVDRRSIVDVSPDDLRGYTQCHFFAGIGGWSYALRLAGWPDDRPVWTGSCPCQPFSVAGAQRGHEDERHLWPAFFRLIRECRPAAVFGEQVAGAAGLAWLDHVCADLEGAGYAVAAADLPACSVGAPHRRQRLWWVADSECGAAGRQRHDMAAAARGVEGRKEERQRIRADTGAGGESERMADSAGRRQQASDTRQRTVSVSNADGAWSDLEWLACSDGKARPTQPGLFPLSDGLQSRLANVRSIEAQAMTEVMTYGERYEADASEVLRMVRDTVQSSPLLVGEAGGRWSLPAKTVLLDFLLDVEAAFNGTTYGSGWTKESAAAHERTMRVLRMDSRYLRTPYQRQSERQQPEEFADPLHLLSFVLARLAEAHGDATIEANAASARVGILRGAGNAIVPQVAAEFIKAVNDVL